MKAVEFDKYDQRGAYHWRECRRNFRNFLEYNPALEARYQVVVDQIKRYSANRLLDVGCGEGYLLGQLAGLIETGIGIDSEAEAVRIGSSLLKNYENCSLQLNLCYELPFKDDYFDVVTSTDVIEHLEDPEKHLAEISRVLKPQGTLVLTTPKWRPDRKWDERHYQEFKPEELEALFKLHFSTVSMNFFWPAWASRIYETKLGWRILKLLGCLGFNPFKSLSSDCPQKYGQMLVVAHNAKAARLS